MAIKLLSLKCTKKLKLGNVSKTVMKVFGGKLMFVLQPVCDKKSEVGIQATHLFVGKSALQSLPIVITPSLAVCECVYVYLFA